MQYVLAYESRTNNNQCPQPMRAMTPLTLSIPPLILPGASISQLFLTDTDPPTPTELREMWPQPQWYFSGTAMHPSGDDRGGRNKHSNALYNDEMISSKKSDV